MMVFGLVEKFCELLDTSCKLPDHPNGWCPVDGKWVLHVVGHEDGHDVWLLSPDLQEAGSKAQGEVVALLICELSTGQPIYLINTGEVTCQVLKDVSKHFQFLPMLFGARAWPICWTWSQSMAPLEIAALGTGTWPLSSWDGRSKEGTVMERGQYARYVCTQ